MLRPRFLLTLSMVLVIGLTAAMAIFLAKGYRLSPKEVRINGTGILSVNSKPDQASVYLDGHLTTATNSNINSLPPKTYDVKIVKEGFIPWDKKVEVKEGLVTEIKATLFQAIPSVYPLTYNGVDKVLLSPDGQKLVFVVPPQKDVDQILSRKRSGIWVWQMSDRPIAFSRGSEPHQIMDSQLGIDFSKANLRWSPDSAQILVSLPDRQLLLDASRFNDTSKDITAIIEPTLRSWNDDQKQRDLTRLESIKDLSIRKIASESGVLKWSPDETKFIYPQNSKDGFRVNDILNKNSFDLPDADNYIWLPDSEHIILVELVDRDKVKPSELQNKLNSLTMAKISIAEYDGFNKSEIYAGNFHPISVFVWPDSSRLMIVSSLPTATASKPNLFVINLK